MSGKADLALLKQALSKLKRYSSQFDEKKNNGTEQIEYRDKHNPPIVLDDKVDKFIEWYYQNEVKGKQTDIGEYSSPIEMRNFIETLAVWYELRYPDIFIDTMIFAPDAEDYSSTIMFKENPYMLSLFGKSNPVEELDWSEFYNFQVLFQFLGPERIYLKDIPYPKSIDIKVEGYWLRLGLSDQGMVEVIENFGNFQKQDSSLPQLLDQLVGKSVKEVIQFMDDHHIPLPSNNQLTKAIREHEKYQYLKKEVLNCAMYRIIERGGKRTGPRRAYLFANEFGCDKNIPIAYGIDLSDPNLEQLLRVYLSDGGSLDLVCYLNYFNRTSKYQKLETITVRKLLHFFPDLENDKKTGEESREDSEQIKARPQKVISYFRKR